MSDGVVAVHPTSGDALLTDLTLVDVEAGISRPDSAILVTDGVVAWIGRSSEAPATEARVIPMRGAFVAPGLINMHTHFSLSLPGSAGDEIAGLSPYGLALYMADGARRTLLNGVTTVRCIAEKSGADFALRDAIAAGRVVGPRIYTAGKALACTGGHGHETDDTIECDGATGFARGVRSQVAAGADVIKIMLTGGIAGENEEISTAQLTREETAAAIETAHAWGRKVTAHAGPAAAIAMAVELGLDCVEHGYQLTPEVCASMAAAGTALVPTLVVTRAGEFFTELGVPEWMQQRSLAAADRHVESYRAAVDAGVEVMLGSDMPPFWDFEGTSAAVRELEYMQEFGLDAPAALRAATLTPARWLGIGDTAGSIEVGKWADLIAMEEDPLVETRALRGIRFVMQAGVVVRDDRVDERDGAR